MAPPKQPWFRFYVEACTDRKLRRLTPAERWLWVSVLAAAKQSAVEGFLLLTEREPLTVDDLADLAGMKPKEVQTGLDRMIDLGLLHHDSDVNALYVVAWANRQYASDDGSARTRKHRAGNVPPDPVPTDDGTFHQRSRNGLATAKQRRRNGPDTETDTETEKTPAESSTSAVAARSVISAFWEASNPRPAVKFIALVKIAEVFIEAGWTEAQLLAGLRKTRAFTKDSIEFTLRAGVESTPVSNREQTMRNLAAFAEEG